MKTLRAHGFNQRPRFEQVVGYLERNEPCPWISRTARPPRSSRATSTCTTLCSPARTPTRSLCSTLPREGFRTPAEATDEDVRLARMYQSHGGTRFVEDDLAGDPEAGAGQQRAGPPSITDRLRSTADGAQAAADLIGAGAAGLAAAQPNRSIESKNSRGRN